MEGRCREYIAPGLSDGNAAGLIHALDAVSKGRMLYAYYEGSMTQARIEDDVERLRDQWSRSVELLGIREPAVVTA